MLYNILSFYLKVQWKSVTPTTRQINVLISYSKYIKLAEQFKVLFSVHIFNAYKTIGICSGFTSNRPRAKFYRKVLKVKTYMTLRPVRIYQ